MDSAQTVARAMAILEVLGKHKSLTAARVNELLGYHRSTTYRLLGTLQQLKYVRKNADTGLYSLSPRILRLGASVLEQEDLTNVAKPYLNALHQKTQETLHLGVLDEFEMVYLDKMESTRNLRVVMSSRKGRHAPLYCTGLGKVLMAWMAKGSLEEYLSSTSLQSYTGNTITGREELMAELEEIRENGYALDREEHELGVICVAAPLRDSFKDVVAALSVSIPSVRLTEELKKSLILEILDTTNRISEVLGN